MLMRVLCALQVLLNSREALETKAKLICLTLPLPACNCNHSKPSLMSKIKAVGREGLLLVRLRES